MRNLQELLKGLYTENIKEEELTQEERVIVEDYIKKLTKQLEVQKKALEIEKRNALKIEKKYKKASRVFDKAVGKEA